MNAWMRSPRTAQAKRYSAADKADGYPPRGKRSVRNIPDNYDDIPRGDVRDKCWKRRRDKQWGKEELGTHCVLPNESC